MAALIKNAVPALHGGQGSLYENCTAEGRTVPMHTFKSAFSKTPMASAYGTPVDIAKALHNVKEVRCKIDAPLITFNEYRQGAQSRGISDILCSHAVCGDIDRNFNQAVFDQGLKELASIGAPVITYQTFSHTPQAPRWRVFVFLDEPALPSDYAACWHGLNGLFGGMLDPAAKDISRLNYWSSCPPGQIRQIRALNMKGEAPAGNIKQALVERGRLAMTDSNEPASMAASHDPLPVSFTNMPEYLKRLTLDATTHYLMGGQTQALSETPENIAIVEAQLACIDSDCDYPEWLKIVLAVASLRWQSGIALLEVWSRTAPHRYSQAGLDAAYASYRDGGVTYGTLVHCAKAAGWKPATAAPTVSTAASLNGVPANDATTMGSVPPPATPAVTAALAANGWEPVMPRFNLAESTAARLFTGAPPAQAWLCEGIFPAGKVCVLASPPGVGKSYLALDLAYKAASVKTMSMAFGGTVRGGGRAV